MAACAAPVSVRFEHHDASLTALGIGEPSPRLSWFVPSAEPDYVQAAYEIEVTRGGVPETYVSESGEQVLVPWPATPLVSRERAVVRVRVRADAWSEWSEPATVEAGLLRPDDWSARFISPRNLGAVGAPAPVLRGTIEVPGEAVQARLYVTAHGLHTISINGERASDDVLAPGWTSYSHRLRYQTYDVTELVRPGTNLVDGLLGNGWYRGRLGWGGRRALYGDRLALLAQLEITTADGSVHMLGTDGSWTARESGVHRRRSVRRADHRPTDRGR